MTALALPVLAAAALCGGTDPAALPADERFPAEIRTVGVVMPASILPQSRFAASIAALEKLGCRVKLARRLSFDRRASVADRVADFEEAWLDPEVDLVMCARGGSGCEDLVDRLDWPKLATRPDQRFVGFSNVTVLLSAMAKRRLGRLYTGPNFGTLGTSAGDTLPWLCRALAGKPLPETQLRVLRPGAFAGRPCGGHIGLVRMCVAAGWMPDASNRVVFLERNCSATVGGIRRELEAIAASGWLDHAAGVVFGDVTPGLSDGGKDWARAKAFEDPAALAAARREVDQVKRDFAAKLACPVCDGFAYGHVPVSHTVDFARTVRVSADGVMAWE